MRFRRLLHVLLLAAIAPTLLVADWRQFLPRSFQSGGSVELFASSEADDTDYGGRSTRWSDDFLKEKVILFSRGYAYHPRFLLYDVELGGAVKQERYDGNARTSRGWNSASGLEYRAKLFLLPEHPYNFELFALRWEPVFKNQSAIDRDSVSTSNGADFRYRKKPYFFHARYTDNTLQSSASRSDVERLGVDGEYFRHYVNGNKLSFNAALNPTRFSNSSGLDGDSTEVLLSNSLEIGRLTLASSFTDHQLDQKDQARSRFESEQRTWYERLTARLPLHFRADVSYRQQKSDSTATNLSDGRARDLSNTDRDLDVAIVHRLYESLLSTYTHRRGHRESERGETLSDSDSLGFNYTKRLPRGRLQAGVSWGESHLDSRGRTEIAEEPHPGVAVPGRFELVQRDPDPSSLVVYLRSPLPPFEAIRLTEGTHYVTAPVNGTLEVTVVTLPSQFLVPGVFDLLVSYTLLGGDYELRTRSFGHSASLELFDHLLGPYYSYFRTDSDVLSGVFPGSLADSTTTTFGVQSQRGPWRARIEYQDVDWIVSPYRGWRAELQYIGSPTPTTRIYGTVTYWNRHYPLGKGTLDRQPIDEDTRSISGSFQKMLFDRTLTLSLGGSYSETTDVVDTNAYSLDASAMWRVGRIDLSAGATYYDSESDIVGLPSSHRGHHYYYLRLRRDLF